MNTIQINGMTHELHQCITCGVLVVVPQEMVANARKIGGYFFCTNGHSQGWRKDESEDAKVRRELDRLSQRVAERDDEIKRQRGLREATERQLSAARGRITKIKNRVSKGVCPCCNRQFANLHRHMTTEHPTFTAEAAE